MVLNKAQVEPEAGKGRKKVALYSSRERVNRKEERENEGERKREK